VARTGPACRERGIAFRSDSETGPLLIAVLLSLSSWSLKRGDSGLLKWDNLLKCNRLVPKGGRDEEGPLRVGLVLGIDFLMAIAYFIH